MFYICPRNQNSEIKVEEKKKGIISRTLDLFSKRGIRSCTMGEICTFQRISKKTLYKYFRDKDDLVESCMSFELERTDSAVKAIMAKGLNAIEESYEISRFVIDNVADLHPGMFFELENFYPDAFKLYEDHQNQCIRVSIYDNLKKGIEEGLYRADLNIDIVVSIYLTILYNILSARLINVKNHSFKEIYRELFNYHTHGISSPKGLEYLQTKLKSNEQ